MEAFANPSVVRNQAVDDSTSPFVQDLLAKTEALKEQRKKERLNDYYRRNYTDYFSFQAGSNMNVQGLSKGTQEDIKKWLQENAEPAPPPPLAP